MKVKYTKDLKDAAKEFIKTLFQDQKLSIEVSQSVLGAAMMILQGVGWVSEKSNEEILADLIKDGVIETDEPEN